MKTLFKIITTILLFIILLSCNDSISKRKIVSLNGNWDLTVNADQETIPSSFEGKVPVPGLADMASFKIDSIGYKYHEKRHLWYKKNFVINDDYPNVVLKLYKVKFGHTVYVNGKKVGESDYCFTPAEYNITTFLNPKGKENELIVRVGAFKDNLRGNVISGEDFEKIKYLSGIYDDVGLILSGSQHIDNIQVAPELKEDKVKLAVYMNNEKASSFKYLISEKSSGKKLVKGDLKNIKWEVNQALFDIDFNDYKKWTPENPILYQLKLSSKNDEFTICFGMRTFAFNTETGRALLNDETYFMRGTNVCIFRFFEDPDRNALPWDTTWVRKLHKKFKSMGWNSIRYCIGFPPHFWYDIADEEGLLIQDEYPIWTGLERDGTPNFDYTYPEVTHETLAEEYKTWMQAHWNHPCVVIWDAQNESVTTKTGDAIKLVRHLDLSNRPWENGYDAPEQITDPIEAHPYPFSAYRDDSYSEKNPLKHMLSTPRVPDEGPNEKTPRKDGGRYPNPIIVNEYGWLWLNRNGTTTFLTDKVYESCFPNDTTSEQRFETYAKHLGILTEYWRAHRKCAGVLHFCGLGYSRTEEPRGATSDNFIDIKNLTFEPNFEKYVKPAFNPVGVFINWFEQELKAGDLIGVPVIIINDENKTIFGQLELSWEGNPEIEISNKKIKIEAFGKKEIVFSVKAPEQLEKYKLELELKYEDKEVKSIREVNIKSN